MIPLTTQRDCVVMLVGSSIFVALGVLAFISIDEDRLKLGILGGTALPAAMIPVSLAVLLEIKRKEKRIADRPELVVTFARSRLAIILAGIAMLLVGVSFYTPRFMELTHPIMPVLMAWVGALLAILGILLPIYALLRPYRLTLSPQGLDCSRLRIRAIPWRDLVAVDHGTGLKATLIYLHLAEGNKQPRDSGGKARPPLVIKCNSLGAPPLVILNAINLRLNAFGEQRS